MMKRSFFMPLVFCLFIGGCTGDFDHYCEGEIGYPEVKFEGVAGEFRMKVKTVTNLSQDTIDLICSEIKKLKITFSEDAKGPDYRISFRYIDPKSSKRIIEVYRKTFPEESFVFWVGLKYYKNDTLAKLLMEIVDVDEIRSSDKYKIEKW